MEHSPGFLKLVNETRARIKEITVAEARERLAQNASLVLLDVREDHEWQKGHAAHARHLGKGILERDLEKMIPDPDTEIILYCGGGFRSALSADAAKQLDALRAEVVKFNDVMTAAKAPFVPVP